MNALFLHFLRTVPLILTQGHRCHPPPTHASPSFHASRQQREVRPVLSGPRHLHSFITRYSPFCIPLISLPEKYGRSPQVNVFTVICILIITHRRRGCSCNHFISCQSRPSHNHSHSHRHSYSQCNLRSECERQVPPFCCAEGSLNFLYYIDMI